MKRTRFSRFRLVRTALVAVLLLGFATLSVGANGSVVPPAVKVALEPGESLLVEKEVTTPAIPPVVDIVLVEDETGSFWDDISNLQALAPTLVTALDGSGSDYATGVVGFRDFAQDPWGDPGDWVYKLYSDVIPGGASLVAGVALLTASGGNDGPEAQLEALHYLATPGHAAIDSNGDGDTADANDTPMGQQPTWRANAQRVVLLATDAPCHITGDAGGWPGDAGTTSAAVTAAILDAAGITVIGLVPNGAGTNACVDALAAGTGGSVHATTASGATIVQAILAGLAELTTDVWWTAVVDPGLLVTLAPAVHYDVPGATTVVFDETITVPNGTDPGMYCATVTFWANEYPEAGAVIATEEICITVIPIPVDIDIKPWSDPNSINTKSNGVVPVAILGSASFDVTTVDASTLNFGPDGAGPGHDLTDLDVLADHYEDANGDGYMDLVSHYRQKDIGLVVGDTQACLRGDLLDGRAFEGCDAVRVLK